MPKKPTPAQAQLHLQLYDLRREAKLRQARDWYAMNFFPSSYDDANRLAPPGSQENTYVRMVVSYWDQACVLVDYGLLHEELFFKTSGEFYLVWSRLKTYAPDVRRMFKNPHFYENLEKISVRYEKWLERQAPGFVEAMQKFWQQMRERFKTQRTA